MNPVAWVPWVRAWNHAQAACQDSRHLHIIAMLVFTSLPVVAASAYAFSATWTLVSSLTAIFCITFGDLNPKQVSIYLFDVPPWLCDLGFRRSFVTKDDGSCFFDSVRMALGKSEQTVREDIANWIKDHKDDDLMLQGTYKAQSQGWDNYTQEICEGNLRLWGDTLEARAVSEIYRVKVSLYSENATTQVFDGGTEKVDLYFTPTGAGSRANHYRPLSRSIFL